MKSLRILLVDDSSVMRRIAITALNARMGINDLELFEAGDGKEALTWLEANDPVDVILMDWNMPNLTGIDCVQQIRGAGNTTPIIMVTTEGESARVVEAIRAGANNYVLKPFNAGVLCEKIHSVLEKEPQLS